MPSSALLDQFRRGFTRIIVLRHIRRIDELPGINDWLDLAHIMMTSLPRLLEIRHGIKKHITECMLDPDDMIDQWSRSTYDQDLIDCFHMFVTSVPISEFIFTYYECFFSGHRFGTYAIVCTVAHYYNNDRPAIRMTIDYDDICVLCQNRGVRDECHRLADQIEHVAQTNCVLF